MPKIKIPTTFMMQLATSQKSLTPPSAKLATPTTTSIGAPTLKMPSTLSHAQHITSLAKQLPLLKTMAVALPVPLNISTTN